MKKLVTSILLFLIILAAAVQVQAENFSPRISGGYTASDGTKYDLIKGAFTFPSAVLKVLKSQDGRDIADISARFSYSGGFFTEDP